MLKKIISGGQTGADQGGLVAGRSTQIETGGTASQGWLTENGPNPDMAEYGLMECERQGYPPRTYCNVRDSDGTIRFARHFSSAGERCTLKAITQYDKPYIDVDVNDPIDPAKVVAWINSHGIETLNVAGNRESTSPGISNFTSDYLVRVIQELKAQRSLRA